MLDNSDSERDTYCPTATVIEGRWGIGGVSDEVLDGVSVNRVIVSTI